VLRVRSLPEATAKFKALAVKFDSDSMELPVADRARAFSFIDFEALAAHRPKAVAVAAS
jgi:hypothetical protein